MSDAPAPLAGVRVLDVSRFVSGPLCTFLLASMGAEVISVESPRASTSRRLPPFAHPDGGNTHDYVEGAISIPFLKRSRGKRSVALDLTHPRGASLVRTLTMQSDVFVENSRSDAMARFGLGYEQLAVEHPRLVYCAISGYGYDVPNRPAMDNIVQAASGVMAKTGFADGPPLRAGITIADHASATYAALGILAALRQRDTNRAWATGRRGNARRADRVGLGRTGRSLRRDRDATSYRKRRRPRCADQHLPLRRRLDRAHVYQRSTMATVVRPHGARRRAQRMADDPGTSRCERTDRRGSAGMESRRGRYATSRRRCSPLDSRPDGFVTQSKRPPTSTCATAGSSASSDIRAHPPIVPADFSAPRFPFRSRDVSSCRPPNFWVRAPTPCWVRLAAATTTTSHGFGPTE